MTSSTAEPEVSGGICSKEVCPANLGGACLEGIDDKLDCDNFELTDLESLPHMAPASRESLPDGEAVWPQELERLMRACPVSTVVPLGRVGAGKTTLMAVTYHLLRSRRLEKWRYAGSETVIGFARRAFEASYASRRQVPTTGRTEKETSGQILHMVMRSTVDDQRYPLVLSDLSGEHVAAVANGSQVEVVREALARADHIPIVLDGGALVDDLKRGRAVYEARALLKMLEKQTVKPDAKFCVVATKGDLVDEASLDGPIGLIVAGTVAESAPYFVTADRASARRDDRGEPVVPLGAGVEPFLDFVARRPAEEMSELAKPDVASPSALLAKMWQTNE